MIKTANLIRATRLDLGEDGQGGVSVELTDLQIAFAISKAIQDLNKHYPMRSYQTFKNLTGKTVVIPDPPLRGIFDLSIIRVNEQQLSQTNPSAFSYESMYAFGGVGYGSAASSYSSPVKYATYYEWKIAVENVYSLEPAYWFIPERNEIHLYLPGDLYHVTVVGALDLDESLDLLLDDSDGVSVFEQFSNQLDHTLSFISKSAMKNVRRLVLAYSKITLGYIRRKYNSVPTYSGESVQMDGDSLVNEGNAEIEAIKEEMNSSMEGYEPVVG